MATQELEAGKARLIKEILMEVDSIEMLDKISAYLKKMVRKEQKPPCRYTTEELKATVRQSTQEARQGMGIDIDELMKESATW